MKAPVQAGLLSALLALGVSPQVAFAQATTPKSEVKPLVPGQGVAATAPTPTARSVSFQRERQADLSGLGHCVYSTGLEDVYLRIVPVERVPQKDTPYRSKIFLLTGEKQRLLGSNSDDRVVRLGRLPAGEIHLGIDAAGPGAASFQTGPGERNADRLPHATVRSLPSGVVEVRFEDLIGLPEGRDLNSTDTGRRTFAARNFLNDVVVQLSGGVTADGGVLTVLASLKDPSPEVRKAAADTLKIGYPRIAKSAGLR